MVKLGAKTQVTRNLEHPRHAVGEGGRRAPGALVYNGLVHSWPESGRLAREAAAAAAPNDVERLQC